jgi:hypothetical protein
MNRQPHAHRPTTTLRSIAWMLLPAIATVVGLWVALVVVLTGGPS